MHHLLNYCHVFYQIFEWHWVLHKISYFMTHQLQCQNYAEHVHQN
jgi:hypothetical protein